jgi:hypothetical protein
MRHLKRIFTSDQEQKLVVCVQAMESRYTGLTNEDQRKLAYQLA